MNKKYELTNTSIKFNGHTLYRIRALRPFKSIYDGCLGGYVESEDNLSHEGWCWVRGDAQVYGNARVYDDAWLSDGAKAYGNARVYGGAWVAGKAQVMGEAQVYEHAHVFGNAKVYGNARVCKHAQVYENARIYGNACVYGDVHIAGEARVYENANVFEKILLHGKTKIFGDAYVSSSRCIYIGGPNIRIKHGIWNQYVIIDGSGYLLSSTLEKMLVSWSSQ